MRQTQHHLELTEPSRAKRLYSEKELSKILQRALQIQQKAESSDSTKPGGIHGYALADLEQIAAEVGIESRHVQAAIAEAEAGGDTGNRFSLLGGPASFDLERIVEGEVSEEDWADLVQEIRRSFNQSGTTEKLGNSLGWKSRQDAYVSSVAVSPRSGRTRIQFMSNLQGVAIVSYILPAQAALIASVLLSVNLHLTAPVELAISGSLFAGAIALSRSIFSSWARNHGRMLKKLMDRIEARIADSGRSNQQ